MKYKVRITKQPKFQYGGDAQDDSANQVIQVIKAYAQAKGIDPQELVSKLQGMNEQEQQQAVMQMYQELQSGGFEDMGYDMPTAAYGGQMGYGLDLGARRLWMNQNDDEESEVNKNIKEVPRNIANIEAEGGETIMVPTQNNDYNHYNIQGKRHTQGGVPLNVPEGSFVFSDTKKMKMGGPVLSLFGKSVKSTKKFTPADIAKQYDINKYKSILEDPRADDIKKRTAELMIQNYNKKLAQLALVQEGKKGYPQGIPVIAQDYYAKMMQASDVESKQENQEEGGKEEAMYGGSMKYGGGLKRFQGDEDGSQVTSKNKNNAWHPPMAYQDEPQKPFWLGNFGEKKDYYDAENPIIINDSRTPSSQKDIYPPAPGQDAFDKNITEKEAISTKDLPNDYWTGDSNKDYNVTFSETKKPSIQYGWTNPDKLNLLNSLINMAGVKKYTPFEPTMKLQRPDVSFLDPSRALAANAEQMNAARQAAGMFAGPQSRYSFNAGQFGKNAADIIGQYANQNVAIGNQAAQQAANVANQQAQFDAQRAKRLYDAGIIGEQQYQNAMRQARAGVLQAYAQGHRNAADIYNMNVSESPYYAYHPGTGTMYFHSPKAMKQFYSQQNSNSNDDDLSKMRASGFKTLDDWAKSLGYANYDQKLKSDSNNRSNIRTRSSKGYNQDYQDNND